MSEKERRRYTRVALDRPGVIRIAHGPETNTHLTEISEGGVRCLFSDAVSLGAIAELRFILPVAVGKECVLVGRVQHYHKHDERYVLGVEFTRVAPDVADAIRAYVRQHLKS